jgi:hypothetical protein
MTRQASRRASRARPARSAHRARGADDLSGIVELVRLGKVGNVAGVDHERWLGRERTNLSDGFLEGAKRVRIHRLHMKANVAVRDLRERE